MRAGALRHRIVIQAPVTAQNARGVKQITAWSTVATVYAEVKSISGREQIANDQVTPVASHQITIRYRTNVTTVNRVKWNNRYFGIAAILEPDNRMRLLQLQCNEIVGTDRAI